MILGHQIQYVINVIDARMRPLDAGSTSENEMEKKIKLANQLSHVIMQIIISLTILICCFILFFLNDNKELHKIASGLIGTVVGYWLR